MFKPSAAELENMRREGGQWESAVGDDGVEDGLDASSGLKRENTRGDGEKSKGLADRGKEWIKGKLGK